MTNSELKSNVMTLGNKLAPRMSGDRRAAFVQAWAIVKAGGLELAVKFFSPTNQRASHAVYKQFFRELSALIKFHHPCIVQMVGFQLRSGNKGAAIACTFVRNGSLADVLKSLKDGTTQPFWNPTGIAILVAGLVWGLKFIHAQKAIHRDIKPSNLFVNDKDHLQIGDFTSCRFSNGTIQLTRQPGNPHYQAPELYEADPYDDRVDIFSFGLVLYEILAQEPVFSPALPPPKVMAKLLNGQFITIPDGWQPPVKKLLERCLRMNATARPSAEEVGSFLQEANFQILPDVDADAVQRFVDEIQRSEVNSH
jgi:serine/threonine protein kinase